MSIKTKILKLEQALLGRSGLPRWAIEAAEQLVLTRKLHAPGAVILQQEIMKYNPNYIPTPPEPPLDVDAYAADLVKKFGTFESYRTRFAAGREGAKSFDRAIERLKAIAEESA